MTRPSDWSTLGLKSDPTPGSPANLRTLSNRFDAFADDALAAKESISSMQNNDDLLEWTGKSGDAFREQFGAFPGQVEKVERSHRMVGTALSRFTTELEEAQSQADRALRDGQEAEAELARYGNQLSIAQSEHDALSRKVQEAQQHVDPDPAAIQAALRDLESRQAALVTLQGQTGAAEARMSGAKTLAEQARQMRATASKECVRQIREASDAGIQPRSFWTKLKDGLGKVWSVIADAASWIGMIAGGIAFIFGGPLAWVAFGAALIGVLDSIGKLAKGKGNWFTLVKNLVGLIPGTKGLTTWTKFSGVWKQDGAAAAFGVIGAAMKTSMKAFVRDGIDAVKLTWRSERWWGLIKLPFTGTANFIRNKFAGSKANDEMPAVGDPVDVSTGRVFVEQIDVPGLRLERTHRSDHRLGRHFGANWASTLDVRIRLDGQRADLVLADGTQLSYPLPEGDDVVIPEHGRALPLRRAGSGLLVTDPRDGWTYVFAAPRTDDAELAAADVPAELLPAPAPRVWAELAVLMDAAGNRVEIARDDDGTPVEVRHSDGRTVLVTTDAGLVTALHLVDTPGATPRFVAGFGYRERLLTAVINPSGLPLRFGYDTEGRMTSWEDRNGMWYRYHYDTTGRCVRTEGRDGFQSYTFRYEPARTLATNSLGHTTVFDLNDDLQVIAETDPLGGVVRTEWDREHHLLARTDQLGRVTRYGYGPDGRLDAVLRPDGSHVEVYHDGSRVTAIAADGLIRAFTPDEPVNPYTGFGARPAAAYRGTPIPGRIRRDHDAEGNEIAATDAAGRVSRTEYGAFDLVVATISPSGARTTYTYDTELQLTAVTEPGGRTWHYRYDPAGRLTTETDFDGRTRHYTYDAAGHLVRVVNNADQAADLRYDLLGNLIERRSDQVVTTFAHDALGRVVAATGPDAHLTVDRDPHGRVTAETVNGRALTYTYDDAGSTVLRRTPSGVESSWTVGAEGRPTVLRIAGRSLAFTYRSDGLVVEQHWTGAGGISLSYDQDGRLTGQRMDGRERRFEYTADGRLTGVVQDGARVAISYDPDGRIIAVDDEHHRYDASGALTGPDLVYHDTDLVSAGETLYTYDAEGRLATRTSLDGTWNFHWNADSRLTAVDCPGGDRWRYRYDPCGRRIAKEHEVAGTVTDRVDFTWDGPRLTEQTTLDGTVTTWEYDADRRDPLVQIDSGWARLVLTDPAGAVTAVEGHAPAHRTLWGVTTAASSPLRFAGQYHDPETGLHYNVHRYYDPATGRYVSHDPLGLRPAPSPVRYVDNPLQESDPLGLNPGRGSSFSGSSGRGSIPDRPSSSDIALLDDDAWRGSITVLGG
ncbi:RHS repeat-associated core domain-containing protein [Actinoplanes sp. NBRC 101535]|uniref:RHS repeat-associated core domain-containing protein n=1 Tax=Actinoplanes sp. NBRC 101535 TaxID=3032196 RepID=UPI0024A1656F|nr:RHS repeat-associated core domain-containing protein [Actinoplanes sp. NBRC 101535]GLY08165.1 hypothetical protein Acsp01_85440 [Actinoplanes sp. NBRC 101535]